MYRLRLPPYRHGMATQIRTQTHTPSAQLKWNDSVVNLNFIFVAIIWNTVHTDRHRSGKHLSTVLWCAYVVIALIELQPKNCILHCISSLCVPLRFLLGISSVRVCVFCRANCQLAVFVSFQKQKDVKNKNKKITAKMRRTNILATHAVIHYARARSRIYVYLYIFDVELRAVFIFFSYSFHFSSQK